MGRRLGILGMVVGVIGICGGCGGLMLFLSNSELSDNFIEAMFCHENESLIHEQSQVTDSEGDPATSVSFYCSDNQNGKERAITDKIILGVIGGFILPFCCGLFLVMGSSTLLTASWGKMVFGKFTNAQAQPINDAQVQQILHNLLAQIDQDSYTDAEIEERVRKIQEMIKEGTLTQEQYFNIEQELRSRQRY